MGGAEVVLVDNSVVRADMTEAENTDISVDTEITEVDNNGGACEVNGDGNTKNAENVINDNDESKVIPEKLDTYRVKTLEEGLR